MNGYRVPQMCGVILKTPDFFSLPIFDDDNSEMSFKVGTESSKVLPDLRLHFGACHFASSVR